jgi:Helicase conserved C-terminal domain
MASSLSRWLGTLTPEALAGLLSRRPEAMADPPPHDLTELARRLQGRMGVAAAFQSVPLAAVQLVDIVRGYPCRNRAELAAVVGEDGLDETLDILASYGLMWEYDGVLAVPGEVATGLGYPLRLGPGVAELLDRRTPAELRGLAATLGIAVPAVKRDVVATLAARYADGDWLRSLAAVAPPATRAMLDRLTWHGPTRLSAPEGFVGPDGVDYAGAESWAVRHGLLSNDGWEQVTMPREVALALRGPGWRPPFDPHPPRPELVAVPATASAGESTAAAGALVDQVGALLAAGPVALLKGGGVGAREQRRLARAVGADEPGVRLAVELARGAGLLAASSGELLPTKQYDAWLAAEPAERLLPLLVAWYRLPAVPLLESTALARDPAGLITVDLRLALLAAAADLPDGQAPADDGHLAALLRWRAPILAGAFEDFPEQVRTMWTEAGRLGLAAHGCLTPLGRALVRADAAGLAEVARTVLDRATTTAIFQADLTAMVAGTPAGSLAELLDNVADREARGAASTWRFSAGSVRRALDAGRTAGELLADLRAAAADGNLPQPLEYLVADAARRHGQVRVRAVGCVLRADDPALLAELLACRPLAQLRLSRLAPTVLASAKPPAETLATLRTAGYAPVGEDADGLPRIERAARRRAKPAPVRRPLPVPREAAGTDPAELAAALLAGPRPSTAFFGAGPAHPAGSTARPATGRSAPDRPLRLVRTPQTLEVIETRAPQLDPAERRLLAHAIDNQSAVRIDYVDSDGQFSSRIIEDIALDGAMIEAWCRLRGDERMFALSRIDAVSPAT